ncbi:MAG TPA: hypothetical protein PLE30_05890 [Candidatus Kapabacteria bacterium]|nr:hypothetical protein [Candidatus Kapabacteria bacterium]
MKSEQSDEKVVNELESILKKSKGKISPGDASTLTGYPIQQVKDALARLIEVYEARVTMDSETGQVQFIFNYPLFKRGTKTFKEYLQIVGEWIWKVFQIVYKAAIGVTLILYTVIFVLILIVVMFSGKDNDRDSNFDLGDLFGGLFRGILDAYTFSMISRDLTYGYDYDGNRYRSYTKDSNKGKNFVQSVYSFVFGPDRPKYNPLDDAKEAASYIRVNKGKLTAGNIVALAGVNFEEAEARLAEYTVRFNGDLEINNDGSLVADFTDLMNKKVQGLNDGKIVFYEDEVEAPYELTGNSNGRNLGIAGMNIFNFVMAMLMISFFMGTVHVSQDPQLADIVSETVHELNWLIYVLGYFPLVFSTLFFVIPGLRALRLPSKKKERQVNILRKKVIGAILRDGDKSIRRDTLINQARVNSDELPIFDKTMERLIIELKGEINIDSDGSPLYTFERLKRDNNL